MLAAARLAEPIVVERVVAEPNKKLIGPRFKGDQKKVITTLEALEGDAVLRLRDDLQNNGSAVVEGFSITPELVSFSSEKKTVVETKYTPSVIEPSYGVGRILYSVLEHAFYQRNGDEQRCVMRFKPCVAPVKVGLFRLVNNAQFDAIVDSLRTSLLHQNMASKADSSSGTIGRRYARSDELGVPFGVTVDFQTLIDDAVTLRERDSMTQVRVPLARVVALLQALVSEETSWETVLQRFPLVTQAAAEDEEEEGGASGAADVSKASGASTVIERTTRASFSRPIPNTAKTA